MKGNWQFSFSKVVLLFFSGIMIGGAIALVTTNNLSLLGGSLQIISMVLVSIAVLISCRKKEESKE